MKLFIKFFFASVIFAALSFSFFSCTDDPAAPPGTAGTNNAPTGSAGLGKTVLVGETVSLEGNAADADSTDTLTYLWKITDTPAGSSLTDASITGAANLDASFIPDASGEYTVQLTVSDGTDSATYEATVIAVGFAIGLNNNDNTETAYIHNGEFFKLDEPTGNQGGYELNIVRLKEGNVYIAGKYMYENIVAGLYRPVYWKNSSAFPLTNPPDFKSSTSKSEMLEVDAEDKVHIIVKDDTEMGIEYAYWIEPSGYIDPGTGYTAADPWETYFTTAIDEVNGDIYQVGTGSSSDPFSSGYFLSVNLTEIIHNTDFDPDPQSPDDFLPRGFFVVPDATPSLSGIYIFGSKIVTEAYNPAGFTVNGGSWTSLPGGMRIQTQDENIRCMESSENYILEIGTEVVSYSAFIGNEYYDLEIPLENDPLAYADSPELSCIETVSGSVFIGGSYRYINETEQIAYNVAVIWRDGAIVYEGFDDDYQDDLAYEDASFGWESLDFE